LTENNMKKRKDLPMERVMGFEPTTSCLGCTQFSLAVYLYTKIIPHGFGNGNMIALLYPEHLTFNQGVAGSRPARPT